MEMRRPKGEETQSAKTKLELHSVFNQKLFFPPGSAGEHSTNTLPQHHYLPGKLQNYYREMSRVKGTIYFVGWC